MSEDEVVRLERRIAAPPGDVFRYLSEGALWARWQGDAVELEAVTGGVFRVRMAGGDVAEGRVVAIEPNRRVVVSWGWQGHPRMPPGSTTVEFALVPDGDGTIVHLTHRGIPVEDVEMHRAGWHDFLPRLGVVAEGGTTGASPR